MNQISLADDSEESCIPDDVGKLAQDCFCVCCFVFPLYVLLSFLFLPWWSSLCCLAPYAMCVSRHEILSHGTFIYSITCSSFKKKVIWRRRHRNKCGKIMPFERRKEHIYIYINNLWCYI